MPQIVGIDLGTTYSCIAHNDKNGNPVIILNSEGDLITPSVVYFESENNIVVGKIAKESATLEANRVADFVKRNMGEQYSFEVDGINYSAEQISAFILKKLVNDASEFLGEDITDVVITCPAYFGIAEREATTNAGKIAGLNVLNIINEPTAAAFSYGLDTEMDQTILVYDLGGGTFDVTVLEIKDNNFTVISTGGSKTLGGGDWDNRIIDYFAQEFMNEHGEDQDPRDDLRTLQTLKKKAEEAKKALTSTQKYPVFVEHNQLSTKINFTREKFEELTKDLLDDTIKYTINQIEIAKNKGFNISEFILVGGSSRMPMVASIIKSELGFETKIHEPDQAIAKGAALSAFKKFIETAFGDIDPEKATEEEFKQVEATLAESGYHLPAGQIDAMVKGKITNVTSKAFGICVVEFDDDNNQIDCVHHIIDRHAPLPAEKIETGFGTLYENQTEVLIKLAEQADGNSEPSKNLEHNIFLTEEGCLKLPPNLPKNSPIHCSFRIDEDGRLSVKAKEPSSGQEIEVNTVISGIMQEEEVKSAQKAFLQYNVS